MQTSFDFTANESVEDARGAYIRECKEWLSNRQAEPVTLPENCFQLSIAHGFGRIGVDNMQAELFAGQVAA